jgi:hypothetical protein
MLRGLPGIQHYVSVRGMTLAWRAPPVLAFDSSFHLRDGSPTPSSGPLQHHFLQDHVIII